MTKVTDLQIALRSLTMLSEANTLKVVQCYDRMYPKRSMNWSEDFRPTILTRDLKSRISRLKDVQSVENSPEPKFLEELSVIETYAAPVSFFFPFLNPEKINYK